MCLLCVSGRGWSSGGGPIVVGTMFTEVSVVAPVVCGQTVGGHDTTVVTTTFTGVPQPVE